MAVISIAEVDPQGMVHWSTPLVHVPALRVDSIVVRLTGFVGPLSQPDPFWRIRTESGMPCYHSITQNHIFAEAISKLGKLINIYI